MKSMVDVSLLNEAESTMSDLAELLDINSQIGETLVMVNKLIDINAHIADTLVMVNNIMLPSFLVQIFQFFGCTPN